MIIFASAVLVAGEVMSKIIQLYEHKRKRRTSERPDFIDNALYWRSNKRWGVHKFAGTNVSLRCHSKAWEQVGDLLYSVPADEQSWIKRQSRFGSIEIDGEKVGAIDATRYETDTLIDTSDFVQIMDMDSAVEAAFGVILGDAWEHIGLGVTDFGTIIHLNWAWTDPRVNIGVPIGELFRKLLQPWLPTHAIMALKAFPLEYEGYSGDDGDEGAEFDIAFRRRRRALVRLFQRYGFELFPGKSGGDGWMFRVADRLRGKVEEPSEDCLAKILENDGYC